MPARLSFFKPINTNMRPYIILLTLSLLAACTQPLSTFEQIKALEQSDQIGTPEGLAKLAELHREYGMNHQDSLAKAYLYASAMHYFFQDDKATSKTLFEEFLNRKDSGERVKNTYFMMADIYANEGKYDSMNIMISAALKDYIPNNKQWNDMISLYKSKIEDTDASVGPMDYEKISLGYTALGQIDAALEQFDLAIEKYPDFEGRATLIYRAGFVAWEYAGDVKRARKYYEMFLTEYPNHELYSEVSQILNSGMLDMTDEQILEMLKSKQ